MKYQVLNLREEPINGFMPTLTTYVLDETMDQDSGRKLPAIVVCPGGGYGMCSKREAEIIAMQFTAAGYHAFVLNYAVAPANHYPEPQKNLSDAISLVRENAEEWRVDKDKIAVIGFSAGGHLAASVTTMWNKEPLNTYNGTNKPNAAILAYPVISSEEGVGHMGSFYSLCGEDNKELIARMSLETQVDSDTAPCFIWHTFTDTVVPVENSLRFATALNKAKIPFEMHIFPDGPHGASIANHITAPDDYKEYIVPEAQIWVKLAVDWLNRTFNYGN